MRTRGRLAAPAAALLLLLLPSGAWGAREAPICQQPLPTSADGTLRLANAQVAPGGEVLAVLTGFRQWPAGLVGGGSGETFLGCTPWRPLGDAEVMPHQDAALLLLPVPATATPGTYRVGVVFREGSRLPSGDGRLARLTVPLVVTRHPVAGAGTSAACGPTAATATTGVLLAPARAAPGATVRLRLTGVPTGSVSTLNEADRLWFVACIAGRATAVAHTAAAPSAFDVRVPTRAGPHAVRVTGVVDGRPVSWQRTITVAAPAGSPSAAPTTAPPPATPTAPTGAPTLTAAPTLPPVATSEPGPSRTHALLLLTAVGVGVAAAVTAGWALVRRRSGGP